MPIAALLLPLLLAQGPLSDLTKPQEGRSHRETSTFREGKDGKYDRNAPPLHDLRERSNSDNFRVQPGQTHVLMDVKGSGEITHMWLTFLGPEIQNWAPKGSANHQEMLLRIYWDGNPRPAVEAPVGDFFANCFGKRSPVVSIPVMVEDADSYNCFWRMPFRKGAKIEIVNQSDKAINLLYYNIDWIEKRVARDTPYFYAQYRQEYPAASGRDYLILDTKGKGHYVGTVLAVRTRSPEWFGEGDERIYIDGETVPSIQGTGTEDYFLSAWGLKTTSTLYSGTPYFDQWGIVGGHTSAYRWHLNDPIVFQKGIRVTIEHFGWMSPDENPQHLENSWNEREDDFSSVAFWYQQGTPTFAERAPADRKLPNIDRVIARDESGHGIGNMQKQQLDIYETPQLLYMPPTKVMDVWFSTGEMPAGLESPKLPNEGTPPAGWKPTKTAPAWIAVPFEVAKKEPLRLLLNMTTSYDFGIYKASLVKLPDVLSSGSGFPENRDRTNFPLYGMAAGDGMVAFDGQLDLYSADVSNREFHLLDFWPDPGKYVLRLECVGKNPMSRGYYLGIESVRLRERRPRVSQYGWDKDKDWRKNPTLY